MFENTTPLHIMAQLSQLSTAMVPSLCISVFEATFTISTTKHTESTSSQRQNTSVENITLQLQENSRRWRQPESSAGPWALQSNLLISQVWDKHTTYASSKMLLLWENMRSVRHFFLYKINFRMFQTAYKYLHVHIYIYTYCQTVQYCLLLLPHKLQGKQSKLKCCRPKGSFLLPCHSQGKLSLHSTTPATWALVLKLVEPHIHKADFYVCEFQKQFQVPNCTRKSDPTDVQGL